MGLSRGHFRLRGEAIEIFPAYSDEILRLSITNGRLKKLTLRPLFGGDQVEVEGFLIYPAKHYLTNPDILNEAFRQIKEDLKIRTSELKKQKKMLEAHRLKQRVRYDLEMIAETGYVNGIENYSRYFDGRAPGEPPWALIDYFQHLYGRDFLVIIDESHMAVPQLGGMYRGDRSRKKLLIEFGFRLPSCLDNRPLKFAEYAKRAPQTIYVSATPNDWEVKKAGGKVVEQLVRPTGLVDPEVMVRPEEGQIQDLVKEILKRKRRGERVLVTTLTKKMAEDLSRYYHELGLRVRYLHSEIDTLDRVRILRDLRKGKFDALIGINLLREGLDLPEVSLVAILDADKEGFLRSSRSLIQTFGRAARNVAGKTILYADIMTDSMKKAISETNRRRKIQQEFNKNNNITPQSIKKRIDEVLTSIYERDYFDYSRISEDKDIYFSPQKRKEKIENLEKLMREAARNLEFEKAARFRDELTRLKKRELEIGL